MDRARKVMVNVKLGNTGDDLSAEGKQHKKWSPKRTPEWPRLGREAGCDAEQSGRSQDRGKDNLRAKGFAVTLIDRRQDG